MDLGRFLRVAAPLVREAMLSDGYKADTCVLATRLGMDALRPLRIHSAPLAVAATAANAKHEALVRAGRIEEAREGAEGAWAVGVGHRKSDPDAAPAPAGRWDGHLVLIVERSWLVDLAADQMNRPAKSISVPGPIVTHFDSPLSENESLVVEAPDASTFIRYRPEPRNTAWKDSADWTEREKREDLVARIVPALRRALDAMEATA